MYPPLSSDHRNIKINNTDKPSLHTCLFTGFNQAIIYTVNGTRTVYICFPFNLLSYKCLFSTERVKEAIDVDVYLLSSMRCFLGRSTSGIKYEGEGFLHSNEYNKSMHATEIFLTTVMLMCSTGWECCQPRICAEATVNIIPVQAGLQSISWLQACNVIG